MNRFVWLGLGAVGGFVLAGAVGVMVVDLVIPWEDVCAVLGPAQGVAETGSTLLVQLQDWLTRAESLLATMSSAEEAAGTRTGLAGLLDKATGVTGELKAAVVDLVAMPLRALIDLAKVLLGEVQAAVDAARDVIASVDAARCD